MLFFSDLGMIWFCEPSAFADWCVLVRGRILCAVSSHTPALGVCGTRRQSGCMVVFGVLVGAFIHASHDGRSLDNTRDKLFSFIAAFSQRRVLRLRLFGIYVSSRQLLCKDWHILYIFQLLRVLGITSFCWPPV